MLRTLRADGVYDPEKVLDKLAINPAHLGTGKDKIRMQIKRAVRLFYNTRSILASGSCLRIYQLQRVLN